MDKKHLLSSLLCYLVFIWDRQIEADLHVSVQFFQQRWVSLQSGEGFTQTGGQSQDPRSGRPLWLHVLSQLLTVMHTHKIYSDA